MPQVTINVNSINYTVGYDGTFDSPQGLLPALNALGFGIFYIATDGPINYLTTIDDNDIFGDISTAPDEILLTCNSECLGTGFDGEGSIIASAFIGGDGIFTWIAIGTTTGDAIANVNGLDRESIIGVSSYQFTNLTNGTYFVAIKDNTGNVGVSTGTTIDCTPIPTTTTSTTTTTTTAAATSTTTTTTTAAATTTSTTTSTTTAVPTYKFSATNALTACYGGTTMTNVVITGGTTFCTATTIQADEFAALTAGDAIFISSGSKSRPATIDTPNTSGIATLGAACTDCPVTTTTTSTTTTTTTAVPTYKFSATNALTACYSGTTMTNVVITGGTTFCTATTIQADEFAALTAGDAIFISSGGKSRPATINTPNTSGIATLGAACTDCPVTTTTTSTTSTSTTAASTTTTTTTSTTTTTTTAYRYSAASQLDACYAGLTMTNVVLTGGSFCAATTIQCDEFALEAAGISIFVRFGTNSRTATINDPNVSGIATFNTACTSCPATTTTTTTTSSTTTTTTASGTPFARSSNTFGTNTLACTTGTGDGGLVYQRATLGTIPIEGAQLYTSSTTGAGTEYNPPVAGIRFMQYGSSNKYAVFVATTGIMGAVFDCNATTTTTTSSTTTTTTLPCECWTVVNEDSVTINYTVTNCDGTTQSPNLLAGATRNHCIQGGSIIVVNSPIGGLLGEYDCGTTCSIANDCAYCGPSTTTTTTTTSSTTTTTTLAGIAFARSSNTFGTETLACFTGTGDGGLVYQKNELGNVPVTGAQLYTSSTTGAGTEYNPPVAGIRFMQFGGSTKYAVFVATTGIMGAVTACNAVTTTTSTTTSTTTPAPTTTTTTTTSSTTTTTTLAGIAFARSSNTFGNETLACINGTGDGGLVYQKNELGNVPVTGAQLYTSSTTGAGTEYNPPVAGIRFMQFGGSTKYAVFVATTGIMGAVTPCSGVSTTTTSTTTSTTTPAPTTTTTTTTSTTSTTTTAAPTFVYNVNQGEASAFAACFSSTINTYIWSFSGTFASGTTYYLGTSTAPTQPIQAFAGDNLYYSYEGFVITIDNNGAGGNYQPCPTTTTTIPPTVYSQYQDCSGNDWYAFSFITGDGTSSQVPDNCVFYQGTTTTPAGTQFTDFLAGSGCFCP